MTDNSPSARFISSSRVTKAKNSQLISVRLPDELLQRLANVGNEEGFTMSDTIRVVLERGLRSTKKKGSST
jgi:metal-responsive CopG/Arc/MetJ family transcriptional regulator